nr:phosphotransferase [Pseudoruegeria sp. HB172150]
MAVWPGLRERAGLPEDGWSPQVLSRQHGRRYRRIVLLMERGEFRVVLKRQIHPSEADVVEKAITSQLAAQDVFPQSDDLRLARVLAFDRDTQASLTTWETGEILTEALSRPDADHRDLLRRTGRWASTFHRSLFRERRAFQPRYSLAYLDELATEVRSGARQVSRPNRFLKCVNRLHQLAPEFEGRETVSSMTHGDLHLRNIVIAPGSVSGIDFAGGNSAPVGHDLSRLLVDYATLFGADAPKGVILSADTNAGFFEGYDLVGPDDPSVGFLIPMRILTDWIALPARPQDRRPAQKRRMQGLKPLIDRVFDE